MIAGIDHAAGDGIVCMDADLQHPPECLPEIVKKLEEGYEVINMVRTRNKTAGFLKERHVCGFLPADQLPFRREIRGQRL